MNAPERENAGGRQRVFANTRYGVAQAERLWPAEYGRLAHALAIGSELDAVCRMIEHDGGAAILLRITDARDGVADLQASALDDIATADRELPMRRIFRRDLFKTLDA
jgi:hypothetical protein